MAKKKIVRRKTKRKITRKTCSVCGASPAKQRAARAAKEA